MGQKTLNCSSMGKKKFLALQKTQILFLVPVADAAWSPRSKGIQLSVGNCIHKSTYTKI